jgi:hypothetical protein
LKPVVCGFQKKTTYSRGGGEEEEEKKKFTKKFALKGLNCVTNGKFHSMWVDVTTTLRVLWLRVEETASRCGK